MKLRAILAVVGMLATCLSQLGADTPAGVYWRLQEFDAARMDLRGIAFREDTFSTTLIAVGENGAIRVSDDGGDSWENRNPGFRHDLWDVVPVGSNWLAVGGPTLEAPAVLTSSDTEIWTSTRLGGLRRLECIGHSPTEILAMGGGGSIARSTNSESWTTSISGNRTTTKLAWAGDKIIATALDGSVRTSADGYAWTIRWENSGFELEALASDGSGAVVSGLDLSHAPILIRSGDGITWTPATVPPSPFDRIRDIAWTGTRYVAAGDDGWVYSSPDGISWTQHQLSPARDIHALHWTGYYLLAVGQNGFIAKTSAANPDEASDWTIKDAGSLPRSCNGMTIGDVAGTQRLVTVGGLGQVMTSDDEGTNRSSQVSGTSAYLKAITTTSIPTRTFLAVGSSGSVISSDDGNSWISETSNTTAYLTAIAWSIPLNLLDDPRAIIVGADGTILTSQNGASWSPRSSGTSEILYGVASGTALVGKPPVGTRRIVSVGSEGTILTSSNGTTWAAQVSGTTRELRAVTALDFGFIAVGDHGTILRSSNGTSWTSSASGLITDLFGVTWTGSQVVAVGKSGVVCTSPDGITWTRRHTPLPEQLNCVLAMPSGRICAGGFQEGFITSDAEPDFADWIADEPTPPGQDGPEDDPNGDGIDNLTAYAHFIDATGNPNPLLLALLPRMLAPLPDGRMRLRCVFPGRHDLDYIVEQSDSLEPASWSELFRYSRSRIPPVETLGLNLGLASGLLTIDLPDHPDVHPRRFHRLRLELDP